MPIPGEAITLFDSAVIQLSLSYGSQVQNSPVMFKLVEY